MTLWFRRRFFNVFFFHDAPGAGPVWTPGSQFAGFIKMAFIHCYTQNRKALGLVVLCFSHCKSMGANDPWGGAFFDPRGMVGRIYKEDHCTLLHTKYESFSEKKIFVCFSHDAPGAGPIWTSGARLVGFINRTFIHSYTQIERLWAWWFWRRFVLCFPIVSPWELMTPGAGPFLTPGAWLAGFIKRTTIHCVRSSRIVGTS